ncbi:MAG TPA: prenyltransferase/squalene oxidase repeat-containing protein [Bryobacteraceae bacterium]
MIAVLAFLLLADVSPEQRAVNYLAGEVPRWQRDNHCFSCHNNGDGARALYAAARRGFVLPKGTLDDTTRWLLQPAGWDRNQGTPGFSNAKLARIQFAAALAEAFVDGYAPRTTLIEGARLLLPDQETDGSWRVDTGGAPGAPATYGIALATYMARHTLETAGAREFAGPIARANRWFLAAEPANLLETATLLLALPRSVEVKRKWLDQLLRAQTAEGGWGPQLHAPAEPFDTAIVLLALDAIRDPKRTVRAAARGRAFLVSRQEPDGSWPETTRPPGQITYAEHISTSGWALYALLTTGR